MHSKLARRVLGTLVSAAVMVSMIPAMVFAADATAVDARPTSQINAGGSETVNGIKVEVAGSNSNIGAGWGIGVGTTQAGGTYTFSIDESGDYAGYVITKIEIGVTSVSNCAMAEGNEGWGTLSAGTNLVWEGTATNKVSLKMAATGGGNHTVGYSTITVYVSVPPTGVTVVDADGQTSGYAYVGDVIGLTATVAPEATALTAVTWSTDDTTGGVEIADGVVSASAAGTYNITATVTNYPSVSSSYVFSVYDHVNGATISQTEATVYVDDSLTLTAAPSNAEHVRAEDYTITWSSDNEEVATVANGVVTLNATGNATITATITDNVTSTSYTAQCALDVDQHLNGIAVTPSTLNLIAGSTETLTVTYDPTVYDDTISSPLFLSDNPEVASVNAETGLVEALKEGTATITVSVFDATLGKDLSATCTVTVVEVEPVAMYRLYNPNSGEHFYTADTAERDNLVSLGWNNEGIGWIAPSISNTPVYRLYNPNAGEHHYTTNPAERDMLVEAGWNYENIGWYSDDAQTVPVYRQYNPNEFANNHNYTADIAERDNLINLGWRDEDTGWYAISRALEVS